MSRDLRIVFEDSLLTRGDYRIMLQVGDGTIDRDGLMLRAEYGSIAFDLECRDLGAERIVELRFHLDQPYSRVTLLADADISDRIVFAGLRRESGKIAYRSAFFDHHFSLKDHIRQIDTVLRFSEGTDDLSSLFRSLRYEMAANFNALSNQLEINTNQQ